MTTVDVVLEERALRTDRLPAASVERIRFIEGLRGIAALMVCVGHFFHVWPAYYATNGSFADATGRQLAAWAVWPSFYMVGLFLMISAFSLAYSEDRRRSLGRPATSLRRFALRRAWRIGPTYYVAFVLGIIVVVLAPRAALETSPLTGLSTPLTWGGTLSHLAFVHNARSAWAAEGNGPLWSMAYEVQLYLVFPLLYYAFARVRPAVLGLALVVALTAAARYAAVPYNLALPIFFVAGLWLARAYRSMSWVPTWVALTGAAAAIAIGYLRLDLPAGGDTLIWTTGFTLLILAMLRVPQAARNPANWSAIQAIGKRSYSLYALHFPVLLALYALGVELHLSGDVWVWTMALGGIALSLGITWVGFSVVEKPALERVRRV